MSFGKLCTGFSVFLFVAFAVPALAADVGHEALAVTAADYAAARTMNPEPPSHALPAVGYRSEEINPLPVEIRPENSSALHALAIPYFYPADVQHNSGPTIASAQIHGIYVNCPAGQNCSSVPETFLKALTASSFMHIADQYVGSTASGRYKLGQGYLQADQAVSSIFYPRDINAILNNVVNATGLSGYNHIFAIYLPAGYGVCKDAAGTQCYIPNGDVSFCGYHAATNLVYAATRQTVHVLYLVIPYQGDAACLEPTPSAGFPNSALTDTLARTLSHEVFEIVTDPDVPYGWNVSRDTELEGDEIGDLCQLKRGEGITVTLAAGAKPVRYNIQLEYSNAYHACASAP